ncbi:CpaF family protein [Parachitinimonas caeni]|uniref:ATPase, T2SS/T4P/T4SS family n=1 Tax=Parachitinimonas caeni TaxID=3031301 RepID=A0ABT7E1S3_9NEIS|nr:ATPase, T2SS/T4P/T4SS family [Parachitinimonas caeni]MDK2126260.1 ATPase, T2SS/T4P/T4SS family [Parachitinimonas caeni]
MREVLSAQQQRDQDALVLLREYLGEIGRLMDDPTVQEIMLNRPDCIWVEQKGTMLLTGIRLSADRVEGAIRALASLCNKIGSGQDLVPLHFDARTAGFRFAAVLPPLASNGPCLVIRKHAPQVFSLRSYLERGLLSPLPSPLLTMASFPDLAKVQHGGQALYDALSWIMASGANLLVSGGTSTGKTTLLNALIELIPREKRLITLEDTRELQITHPNTVQIECSPELGLSMQQAVTLLMRMRPDVPGVGEVRDGVAFDYLDLLNTGHAGGFASIHADSDEQALYRLEDLARQNAKADNMPVGVLRRKIASAIHFVVQAARHEGERFPLSLLRVLGVDEQDRYLTQRLYHRYQ